MSARESGSGALLPPAQARTFYNLCDAWYPPEAGRPGAAGVDLAPAFEQWLSGQSPGGRQRVLRALTLLEWNAWLRHRRSFAWLDRPQRRKLLERWCRSALPPRRHAGRGLQSLVASLVAADPRLAQSSS